MYWKSNVTQGDQALVQLIFFLNSFFLLCFTLFHTKGRYYTMVRQPTPWMVYNIRSTFIQHLVWNPVLDFGYITVQKNNCLKKFRKEIQIIAMYVWKVS